MPKKALARRIRYREARSYRRLVPNSMGVTAIAAVNGRGSYARRYARARRLLKNKELSFAPAWAAPGKASGDSPKKKRGKATKRKHTVTWRAHAAAAKAKRAKAKTRSWSPKKRKLHAPDKLAKKRGKSWLSKKTQRTIKKSAAQRAALKVKHAAAAAKKKERTAKLRARAKGDDKRSAALAKATLKKMRAAAKKASATRARSTRAKRLHKTSAFMKLGKVRTYAGKYRAARLRLSPTQAKQTYVYSTRSGGFAHVPVHALLGFKTAAAMKKAQNDPSKGARITKRLDANNGVKFSKRILFFALSGPS